jgi:hypothetical protein
MPVLSVQITEMPPIFSRELVFLGMMLLLIRRVMPIAITTPLIESKDSGRAAMMSERETSNPLNTLVAKPSSESVKSKLKTKKKVLAFAPPWSYNIKARLCVFGV